MVASFDGDFGSKNLGALIFSFVSCITLKIEGN
jgi:hypothetical protein